MLVSRVGWLAGPLFQKRGNLLDIDSILHQAKREHGMGHINEERNER